MKKITQLISNAKQLLGVVSLGAILITLLPGVAEARILFTTEDIEATGTSAPTYQIDSGDTTTTPSLYFGSGTSNYLTYDTVAQSFILSGPLSLSGAALTNFLIENQSNATIPTCDGAATGRMYFNTDTGLLYYCNGTTWVSSNSIANGSVTYAQIQNVTSGTILGRVTAGAGTVEEVSIDTDLSSVSANDDTVASAKAIKSYVDTKTTGALNYKGVLDASSLGTQLDNAKKGDFYKVSVAGTILTSLDLAIGDMVIINKDVTGTPVLADVDKVDNTEAADILRQSGLTSGQFFIGNGTSTPNAVSMSGDATMANTGAVTIANDAITAAKIAADAVGSSEIAANAVGSSEISGGAVTAAKLEGLTSGQFIIGVDGTAANNAKVTMSGDATMANTGAVTIANDAITAAKIAADAVGSSEIAADAVGSSEIAANAVGSSEINGGAVTAAKLEGLTSGQFIIGVDGTAANNAKVTMSGDATMANTGAVTIANDAITAAKIAADAVGSSEIAADAVGSSEIAADAVGSSEIATGAVGTAEIADGTITFTDVATRTVYSDIAPEYPGYTLYADGSNNSGTFVSNNDGSGRNYFQWTTTNNATLQDYDLVFKWTLPENFQNFVATGSHPIQFDYKTNTTNAANNKIDITMLDTAGASVSLTGATGLVSSVANTWVEDSNIEFTGGTFTPGQTITLRIKFSSIRTGGAGTTNPTVAGNIKFNYVVK